MKRVNFLFIPVIIFYCLFLLQCGESTPPGQFTADLIEKAGEIESIGKIYVKGHMYRLEQTVSGRKICVVVNRLENSTRIIVPERNEYLKLGSADPVSMMNDPFQRISYLSMTGKRRRTGTEKIDGYECVRYVITKDKSDVITEWIPEELDFPIRVRMYDPEDRVIELKNIIMVSLSDTLFEVPADYTRIYKPGEEPLEIPEWTARIPTSPLMHPPFEHNMSEGNIVRVKILPGKSFCARAIARSGKEADVRAIPFRDGKPLRNINHYENFARRGVLCTKRHETTLEADEIVVYVFKGIVNLEVKYDTMIEKRIAAGEELRLPLEGEDAIECRVINLTGDESICTYDYFDEGENISVRKMGPVKYRTITLASELEVERDVRNAYGDEFVINAEKGEVLVKMGQLQPFED